MEELVEIHLGKVGRALEQVTQNVQSVGAGKEGAAAASSPQRRRAWAMPFWISRLLGSAVRARRKNRVVGELLEKFRSLFLHAMKIDEQPTGVGLGGQNVVKIVSP